MHRTAKIRRHCKNTTSNTYWMWRQIYQMSTSRPVQLNTYKFRSPTTDHKIWLYISQLPYNSSVSTHRIDDIENDDSFILLLHIEHANTIRTNSAYMNAELLLYCVPFRSTEHDELNSFSICATLNKCGALESFVCDSFILIKLLQRIKIKRWWGMRSEQKDRFIRLID